MAHFSPSMTMILTVYRHRPKTNVIGLPEWNIYMKNNTKRLNVLSDHDYKNLYTPPAFSIEECKNYFSVSNQESLYLENIKSINLKIIFILQLGIFKRSKMFFNFSMKLYSLEINFIKDKYFPSYCRNKIGFSKRSLLSHQKMILEIFNYQLCSKKEYSLIRKMCDNLVKVYSRPDYIYKKIKEHLDNKRRLIPSYSFFQTMITKALICEQDRIKCVLKQKVDQVTSQRIINILKNRKLSINFLMEIQKDFSLGEIKLECQRLLLFKEYYVLAKNTVEILEISHEAIKSYCNLVYYYKSNRLDKIDNKLAIFYFFCFVLYRTEKANDALADSLVHHVTKIHNKAKIYAKDKIYETQRTNRLSFNKMGEILDLFVNDSLNETPFQQIKNEAFKILPLEKMRSISQLLKEDKLNPKEYEWSFVDKKNHLFKQYLRPIIGALSFEVETKYQNNFLSAIVAIKDLLSKKKHLRCLGDNSISTHFVKSNVMKYLTNDNKMNWDRYEFYAYKKLKEQLESGNICIESSLRYRSFSQDLISDTLWKKKELLFEKSSILSINDPIENILTSLEEKLEKKLSLVNERINDDENPYVKITHKDNKNEDWCLSPFDAKRKSDTNKILKDTPPIGIDDLLRLIDQHCNFSEVFKHILPTGTLRGEKDKELILASILSIGTNLGIYKMSQISNVTYKELQTTVQNYISEENIRKANDIICNVTAALPVFKYFGHDLDRIYSSSDGQKFETQHNTLKSRYSSKYFGVNKGITCYSLVANQVPINAKIIGANEYEGHYLFDILYNNTTDISPFIHSTDGHGINQINFVLLYFFGYQFAPRFKTFNSKRRPIHGFKNLNDYIDMIIRPSHTINKDLIISEWESIKKILISLENKTATQAVIVQKLCSYSRKNKTKDALWQMNDLLESIYLLDYIDDISLRQNIERSLNAGEEYHKLKRAIALGNNGNIKGKTEYDCNLWSECSRLIANAVIYYNALIFNQMLKLGSHNEILNIQESSLISWEHINFFGSYEFRKKQLLYNLRTIAENVINSNQYRSQSCL
jgi:TnpA family transposase